MERIMNNIMAYAWYALGLGAAIGVIFCGATHHLFTVAVCAIMGYAMYIPKEKNNESNKCRREAGSDRAASDNIG